jgi:hypothetical protein
VQCTVINNRVFVKSFKMSNFANVELTTDMVLAYAVRQVATRSKRKLWEKFPDRLYLIQKRLNFLPRCND